MTPREERGLVIAATKNIERKGDAWIVPSQNGNSKYTVRPERGYCSCPDHDALGIKCKHLFAVDFVIQRTLFPDGSETVTLWLWQVWRYVGQRVPRECKRLAACQALCESV